MKHKRSLLSIAMAMIMLVSLCAVVSTTSVSAAPSSANATTSKTTSTRVSAAPSSVKTQSAVVGTPAGIVGAPAVCSQLGSNILDLFIRGTDNALWWRHSVNGQWSPWKSLGGYITSSPSAVSQTTNSISVVARGGNGDCYGIGTVDGGATWGAWYYEGGHILAGTGPAAYATITEYGSLRGFLVAGTNHALYYKFASSYHEEDWDTAGGYLTSSPGATTDDYRIAAAGRGGTNGALYATHSEDWGVTYSGWEYKGGYILDGTGPAVASWFNGGVSYFVIGGNNQLYCLTGNSWVSLGGYLISSPAAASNYYNTISLFAVGGDGNIWSRSSTDGGTSWNHWYKAITFT